MDAADTLKKVLRLKHQLKQSSDKKTVLKTLKRLQELDITLDILAETGIGKAVNGFRKNGDAGEVAKTLVHQWKKLVPKESTSLASDSHVFGKEPYKKLECQSEVSVKRPNGKQILDSESKSVNIGHKKNKVTSRHESKDESSSGKTVSSKREPSRKDSSPTQTRCIETVNSKPTSDKSKAEPHGKRTVKDAYQIMKDSASKNLRKAQPPTRVKEIPPENDKKNQRGEPKTFSDARKEKLNGEQRKIKAEKEAVKRTDGLKRSDGEDELPSMSFESFLNYDEEYMKAPKRRTRPGEDKKTKKPKVSHKMPPAKESSIIPSTDVSNCVLEETPKKTSTGSVMDLLNIPLPKFLPECDELSTFPYFEKKTDVEVFDICEEAPIFTGQRLNRKMQVYSGSKTPFLPTMMSLHQQCIRALQNNLDLLYEIGGVPFDILEPVLERCTSEQLLRIEECNPVYVGVTDHLWERHCQKDFRNEKLEEYESWREMYLRLSEERERKLKRLTKSIVSAHSGKPRGRQVKLAFINSVAKPPRNVRIQQEMHGTASSVPLPHLLDKPSAKPTDGRVRPCNTSASTSQGQDPRKMRRVAPMMAKSLKAFKKQLGRR